MDLETENRIAAILMKEAAESRMRAEKEGVHAYLCQPKPRGRPNSRFLTATVRGVQQANRATEVNEMWRIRQKELELEDRLKGKSRDNSSSCGSHRDDNYARENSSEETNDFTKCTSSKRGTEVCHLEDGCLRDEEIEEFLHSRKKRGRGAVGSRMDETGPYLPSLNSDIKRELLPSADTRVGEEWENRVLGKDKTSLKSWDSSEKKLDWNSCKKLKKIDMESSRKGHSKKHRSKEDKSWDKKKKKKSKHGHKNR